MVGEYALDENEQQNNYVNEDCCIVERYPGKLKTLYSQNSFEEGSIAHEFASIDISDINSPFSGIKAEGMKLMNDDMK